MKKIVIKGVEFNWMMILGIILMVGSLVWEIIFGGNEAIVASMFGIASLILGFLWQMNNGLRDNTYLAKGNREILKEHAEILKEIRDILRDKFR